MSIFADQNTAYSNGVQPHIESGFITIPIPGNLSIVGVASSVALLAIQDTRGGYYQQIGTGTFGSIKLNLYAAVIGPPVGGDTGPLHIQAFIAFSETSEISMVLGQWPPTMAANGSTITSVVSTIATGTGVTATCASVTGTGLGLGLFATTTSSDGGYLSVGSGYSVIGSVPGVSGTSYGLVLVAKTGVSGAQTPSLTYANSTTWGAIGAVIESPGAILIASHPAGWPAPSTIAANTSSNYQWPPVPVGVATAGIVISAYGADWVTQPSFSSSNGTAIVTSWSSTAQTATVTVTPSTSGVVTLTDNATSATINFQSGSAWYVNPSTGNDTTGNGTIGTPWATLTHAIANSSGYDQILLEGTATPSSEGALPVTTTTPRYFGQYGTGGTIACGASAGAITSTNCGLTVCGLTITGNIVTTRPVTASSQIHSIYNDTNTHTDGFAVAGCTITGGIYTGVQIEAPNSTVFVNHSQVINNIITNLSVFGFLIEGNNAGTYNISDCLILGNTLTAIGTADGYTSGYGGWPRGGGPAVGPILLYGNKSLTCGTGCVGTNGTPSGTGVSGGIGLWVTWGMGYRLRWNVATGTSQGTANPTYGNDGEGFDLDLSTFGCVVEYNFSYANAGAGIQGYEGSLSNSIRNNICIGNSTVANSGEILITEAGAAAVYNNTCATGSATAGAVFNINENTVINALNNIFIGGLATDAVIFTNPTATGSLLDYNCYLTVPGGFLASFNNSAKSTFAAYQSAIQSFMSNASESHSIAGQVVKMLAPTAIPVAATPAAIQAAAANYALAVGSPGAGTGVNVQSAYNQFTGLWDICGTPIPSTGVSMGAVQTNVTLPNYQTTVLGLNPFSRWTLGDPSGSSLLWDSLFGQAAGGYTSVTLGEPSIIPASSQTCGLFSTASEAYVLNSKATKTLYEPAALSVSVWCNPTTAPANSSVIVKNTGSYWQIGISSAGKLTCYVQTPSQTQRTFTATSQTLAANTLYHIVMTWSTTGDLGLILNGVQVAGTLSGTANTTTTVASGFMFGDLSFVGYLEDADLFPTALTLSQAQSIYNAGITSIIFPSTSFDGGFFDIFTGGFNS